MIFIDRYRKEKGRSIRPSRSWFRKADQQTGIAIAQGASHQISDLYKVVDSASADAPSSRWS